MKNRDLLILVAVLFVVILVAVVSQRRGAGRQAREALVFPELAVNDIAEVTFQVDSGTMSFQRGADIWTSPDTHGYPADFEKVRKFLLALHDLKMGQVVEADDEQKAVLQVVSPTKADARAGTTGTLVTMSDAEGEEIASLVVGKTRNKKLDHMPVGMNEVPDGRYIAVGDDVHLVSSTFSDLPQETADWLDTELVTLHRYTIMELTVAGPDRDKIELKRPEKNGDLQLDKVGWRREMDTGRANDLSGALSFMKFSGIADPELDDAALGLDDPIVWRAKTDKGMVYTVLVGEPLTDGGERSSRHARVSVSYEPPKEEVEESEPDSEPGEDKPEKKDGPVAKAGKLNERLSRWTYVIDGDSAASFLIKRDELTRKKQKK